MKYRNTITGVAVSAFLLTASTALAGDPTFGGGTIKAKPSVNMSNMTMTVTGPDGYYAKQSSSFGSPSLSLYKNGTLADGVYTWELSGASTKRVKANPMGLDYGRGEAQRDFMNVPVTESGSFRVKGGVIITPDASIVEKETPGKRVSFPRFQR